MMVFQETFTTTIARTLVNSPLSKTLPIAIMAHIILILGLGFNLPKEPLQRYAPILDVTLVHTHSEVTSKETKFIAQADQVASGSTDEENRPRSPLVSMEKSARVGNSPIQSRITVPEEEQRLQQHILTTKKEEVDKKIPEASERKDKPDNAKIAEKLSDKEQEMAQLLAEMSREEAAYAKRPRIHFIDAVSAKSAVEARYIDNWVKKIERVGNINFPKEAIKRNVTGKLILNATLDHGGRVVDVKIDVSSGYSILDDAALKIVRLSSPFPPLPKNIRKKWDQLNITRTWIFHGKGKWNTK